MQNIFIGRQAIYDCNMQIYAYELLTLKLLARIYEPEVDIIEIEKLLSMDPGFYSSIGLSINSCSYPTRF